MDYFLNCHTEESIRTRYRHLATKLHPDKNPDDPEATIKFQEMLDERDAQLSRIYIRAGLGSTEAQDRMRVFIRDLEVLKFSKVQEISRDFAARIQKEHGEEKVGFWKVFKMVFATMKGAEVDKRREKRKDERRRLD